MDGAAAPSCPVFRAASRSTSSPPRTSPRTTRSGRILSAWRTNSVREMPPIPSALGCLPSRLRQCGWFGSSSLESSTTTMRSSAGTRESSAPRSVVLPAPVPPLIRNGTRRTTMASSRSSPRSDTESFASNCSRLGLDRAGTRNEMQVPGEATGDSTACNLVPSGSLPSTNGCASSSRLPAAAANRTARRRTCSSSTNTTPARSRPAPRSTNTSLAPLTTTSETLSSCSRSSSGPAPVLPRRSASSAWSIDWSVTTIPSRCRAAATSEGA